MTKNPNHNRNLKNESIETFDIDDLDPHPLNDEIYGDDQDITDLIENLNQLPLLEPIVVNEDLVIISGHRRWRAFQKLERKEIPGIKREFNSQQEEEEFLIASNFKREKLLITKFREAIRWERTHKDDFAPDIDCEENGGEGKMRDVVVKTFHLGKNGETVSSTTYTHAKAVIKYIDEFKDKRHEDVYRLKELFKKSVDAAYRIMKIYNYVHKEVNQGKVVDELDAELVRLLEQKKFSAAKKLYSEITKSSEETGASNDESDSPDNGEPVEKGGIESNDAEEENHTPDESEPDDDDEDGEEEASNEPRKIVSITRYANHFFRLKNFSDAKMRYHRKKNTIIITGINEDADLEPLVKLLANVSESEIEEILSGFAA